MSFKVDDLTQILTYLVPGFLFFIFYERVVGKIRRDTLQTGLAYLTVSSFFLVLLQLELLTLVAANITNKIYNYLIILINNFVSPVIFGHLAAKFITSGIYKKYFHVSGGIYALKTGWATMCSERLRKPASIKIKFNSGDEVLGYFGINSLASSDFENRDIFLERAITENEDESVEFTQYNDGLWVSLNDAQLIEIYSDLNREEEQK